MDTDADLAPAPAPGSATAAASATEAGSTSNGGLGLVAGIVGVAVVVVGALLLAMNSWGAGERPLRPHPGPRAFAPAPPPPARIELQPQPGPETTHPPAPPPAAAVVVPVAPAASRPQAFDVAINGDNAGKPQFEPSVARVIRGGLVRFTNNDTVERSVVSAKPGLFDTGPIAPGASVELDTSAMNPGRYNFTDGTRPFAGGQLEVTPDA